MKKKFSALIGTLITAMACTGIAATALLWNTPEKETPTLVSALDENKQAVTVQNVNYDPNWRKTLFQMSANCGVSEPWGAADNSRIEIIAPNGLSITPNAVQMSDYIYVGINEGAQPEVGTVITLKAGYSYSNAYEVKENVSYLYERSLTPWVEFNPTTLTPSTNELTINLDETNKATVTFTTDYTIAPLTCRVEDGSIATVTSDGLTVTLTGLQLGKTTLEVSCGNVTSSVIIHVTNNNPTLYVYDVCRGNGDNDWGYMTRFVDGSGNPVYCGVDDGKNPAVMPAESWENFVQHFEITNSVGENVLDDFNWSYFQNYIWGTKKNDSISYEEGTVLTFKAGLFFSGYELKETVSYVFEGEDKPQLVIYEENVHKPTGITIDNAVEENDINPETSLRLSVTVTPATAATTVKYSSSNPNVATVDSEGVVTGVAHGKATITARAGTQTATFLVEVHNNIVIKTMKVDVGSTITASYKCKLPKGVTTSKTARIVGTINNKSTETYVHEVTADGEGFYWFDVKNIAPAEMTMDITVALYDNDGTNAAVSGRTVKTYLDYVLINGKNSNEMALAQAMLNYGGYAQTLFNVNTNRLANENLYAAGANPIDGITSVSSGFSNEGNCTGWTFDSLDFLAEGEATLRVYFKLAEGADIGGYKVRLSYVDGQNVGHGFTLIPAKSTQESNLYYVDIPRIAAALLDREYTLTFTQTTDKTVNTLKLSGLSYISGVLNSDKTSQNLKDFAKALYLYNQAANAYFGV